MGDNNMLLMMILRRHFKDRPEILDEALKVIKDYSNKMSTQEEYNKTLSILQEKMKDLPANILRYFLTMVPLPNVIDNKNLEDLIKKSFTCSNIRTILLQYLNRESTVVQQSKMKTIENLDASSDDSSDTPNYKSKLKDPDFVPSKHVKLSKPKGKCKQKLLKNDSNLKCKKLVDICAEYVIKNQSFLQKLYSSKKDTVWRIVNKNLCTGDDLRKCYDVIKDLNKKSKWMRSIDNEEMSEEIIREEYGNSDVFLKEQHINEYVIANPFIISDVLKDSIKEFVAG